MALALRKAAPLKPEIELGKAISDLKSSLDSNQKARFKDMENGSFRSAPTAEEVMRLTAEINCQIRTASATSRCFGTRFTNFLHSVQRYAALGDVVVGGSQNIVACGVWAAVRITIQICIGLGSYLEKLSRFFMVVGQSAPRYESMALLYRRSNRLSQYLICYFTIVVQTCHHFVLFSRKSMLGQIAASLDDSKIRDAQSTLERWSSCIQEEVAFLSSESIEDESNENRGFRALVGKEYAWKNQQRKIRKRLKLLESLSDVDHERPFRQARKSGTSTVFQQEAAYKYWKEDKEPTTLLISGKLGSGKSVTMANIVEDLYISNERHTVVYYFCRQDIAHSLTARSVIGSICRQFVVLFFDDGILDAYPDEASPQVFGFEDLVKIAQETVPEHKKIHCVLDGIDECPEHETREILKALRRMQEHIGLSIAISIRSAAQGYPNLFMGFMNLTTLSIPKANQDIETFINHELQRRVESGQLILGDETIILEIRDTLLHGANGMFLWVVLQINSLCEEKSDRAIRKALEDLPPDLFTTFARILARSRRLGKVYQDRILRVVVTVARPLSIHELREIISVVPGVTSWNQDMLVNDIYSILACCGSLVTLDEEDLSVYLVHQSVRQFLLDGQTGHGTSNHDWHFSIEQAQLYMGRSIVTYLNSPLFETQLSTAVAQPIQVGPLPSHVMKDALSPVRGMGQMALRLLKSSTTENFDAKNVLMEAESWRTRRQKLMTISAFFPYASRYWLEHTCCLNKNSDVYYLWVQLLNTPKFNRLHWQDASFSNLISDKARSGKLWSFSIRVMWAIIHGHIALARHELIGKRGWKAFCTVVPYLRWCMECDPRPMISEAMCTYLLPLTILFKSSSVIDWLLSMGASTPFELGQGLSKDMPDHDYQIVKAMILHGSISRYNRYSKFKHRPIIEAAFKRRDCQMISKLLSLFLPWFDLSMVRDFDFDHPAIIRISYRLARLSSRFLPCNLKELCHCMRVMSQAVNPCVFNPTQAFLNAMESSLTIESYLVSFQDQAMAHFCRIGDSYLVTYLCASPNTKIYIDTPEIMICIRSALHSRSPERRSIVKSLLPLLGECDPSEKCYQEGMQNCFSRCLQLREWELAEDLIALEHKSFGKPITEWKWLGNQMAQDMGLVLYCASAADRKGLGFLRRHAEMSLAVDALYCSIPEFRGKSALELALRVEFASSNGLSDVLGTITLLLVHQPRSTVYAISIDSVACVIANVYGWFIENNVTFSSPHQEQKIARKFGGILVNFLKLRSGEWTSATGRSLLMILIYYALLDIRPSQAGFTAGVEAQLLDSPKDEESYSHVKDRMTRWKMTPTMKLLSQYRELTGASLGNPTKGLLYSFARRYENKRFGIADGIL